MAICSLSRSVGFFGIVFIFLGGILISIWPALFNLILKEELTLSPTSKSYELWKVIPVPMYMEFYLFNWTNPHDIKNIKTKPILQELGPFVFREHRVKVIDSWNKDNGTVTYKQNRTWYFQPNLSKGTLDINITTLNVPAITAAYTLRDGEWYLKASLDAYFFTFRTKYYVTKTVREFIFEGYKDGILDLAKFRPGAAPFDKFGWMYSRNGSADYDGVYNMRTPSVDLGNTVEWNYGNHTSFYRSPCNIVSGSTGELFPPNRKKTSISIFTSDICRSLSLSYKEEVTVNRINGYRYWGDDSMFSNPISKPENWCFCGDNGKNESLCYPNGILNVTTCKWGSPAFISFPHFYHGDPSYRSAVEGMKPNESLHQFFMDVEPETGIPIQVSAGFQINILLQPDKHYELLKNMPRIFFPMIWFRQTAHIDNIIGEQLKFLLMIPELGTIIGYVFLSIGISLLIILIVIYVSIKWKKEDEALFLVGQNQNSNSST